MWNRRWCQRLFWGVLLTAGTAFAQSGARPSYDVEFIGPPLEDSVMQYNKESYVTYGCAYCHGVNLVPRGEAPDLRQSAVVGADVDGSVITGLLRAGVPQTTKLSPMPQYSDLSEQQLNAIADWIHYARQRDRYAALMQAPLPSGDRAAGATFFERSCASCHSTSSMAAVATRHDQATLRGQMLAPTSLGTTASFTLDRILDARTTTARRRHQALLENYSAAQVADLMAYVQGLQ